VNGPAAGGDASGNQAGAGGAIACGGAGLIAAGSTPSRNGGLSAR
jgi:hypothetical protein